MFAAIRAGLAVAISGVACCGALACDDDRRALTSTTEPALMPLRRLGDSEVTPALSRTAQEILREHHDSRYGTEVPFQHGGRRYIARIEPHYHSPGEPGPTGTHKGISLFVEERIGSP